MFSSSSGNLQCNIQHLQTHPITHQYIILQVEGCKHTDIMIKWRRSVDMVQYK